MEEGLTERYLGSILERFAKKATNHTDIALAVAIIGILMVLLFPIPVIILDILLALSISVSIVILMTTLFIKLPLELNIFPALLLITTILRLSLNIASTRLILSEGHNGTDAAGYIIQAFGGFVMQGNVVIGIVVFIILTIINFIVITKGSGRIAEVAARFSLDAMPGKQMAIDADLSAGLINEQTARERRKHLEDESSFYGAMDGANKFVRGDAIAGLLITAINLIGGIIIGMVQRSLTFDKAIHTYTILTIGDGLVSQIPSLIISLAAGLLVSKSGVDMTADKAIFGQLSRYPQALLMSSVLTGLIAFLPGLPFIPFFILSVISGVSSYIIQNTDTIVKPAESTAAANPSTTEPEEEVSKILQLDTIRIELGYDLLALVSDQLDNKLTKQIKALRKQIIKDYGFVMPQVRIRDNMQLAGNNYVIKIKEIECGRGEVFLGKLLAMDIKGEEIKIPGNATQDPAFGLPAKWIDESYKEEALFKNYTVVDPSTVITTHLTEKIKENITELLSYSETEKLIKEVSEEHQKLVKDVIPDIVSISVLQKILQSLLGEKISIRDLPLIIETTADTIKQTSSLLRITETVRAKLSRQICHINTLPDGYILAFTLSSEWEQIFMQNLQGDGEDKELALAPSKIQEFIKKLNSTYDAQALKGEIPVLLTNSLIRPYIRSILERTRPNTVVMSHQEIHPTAKIKTVGVI